MGAQRSFHVGKAFRFREDWGKLLEAWAELLSAYEKKTGYIGYWANERQHLACLFAAAHRLDKGGAEMGFSIKRRRKPGQKEKPRGECDLWLHLNPKVRVDVEAKVSWAVAPDKKGNLPDQVRSRLAEAEQQLRRMAPTYCSDYGLALCFLPYRLPSRTDPISFEQVVDAYRNEFMGEHHLLAWHEGSEEAVRATAQAWGEPEKRRYVGVILVGKLVRRPQ